MSLFPRFPTSEFAPLFRLLDDYDVHRSNRSLTQSIRAFQPKFDVRENKDGYELHGELPGIEQKDVNIEFVDPHTLVIKGRTERNYTSGTPPALEGGKQAQIESGDKQYHKATVEDENAETNEQRVAVQQSEGQEQPNEPGYKYWVSERSVGEFHRSFSFPTRVDQENVKASLKNGVLTIVVPKALAPTSKRINIE